VSDPEPPPSHRHPRYPAFLVSGGALGLLAALVLALGPGADVSDQPRLLGYLAALLGGLIAVLLEGRRG
jgi:hypothetical protein